MSLTPTQAKAKVHEIFTLTKDTGVESADCSIGGYYQASEYDDLFVMYDILGAGEVIYRYEFDTTYNFKTMLQLQNVIA